MSRIWRVALLTLLIALLPLRGWAWAVMPVPIQGQAAHASAHPAVSAAVSAARPGAHAPAATPLHHADTPCHGPLAAAHHGQAAASADAAPGTGHSHTCSLCDLCHAGVIAPPSWAWFHDAQPVSPPSWAVSAPHGRDGGDGLFRPPRA